MTRLTFAAALLAASSLAAQTHARNPSDRLGEVLPAPVTERVRARIADARAHRLPVRALEQRALMLARRGVAPDEIERAVAEHAERTARSAHALERARGHRPGDDEVEAGAEAIRHGLDGAAVSALARSAPSGRSLAVPLYVIGSLVSRGLPSDDALARVRERVAARASDADLERLPNQVAERSGHGRAHASGSPKRGHGEPGPRAEATHRRGPRAGRPSIIPGNPGRRARPAQPGNSGRKRGQP